MNIETWKEKQCCLLLRRMANRTTCLPWFSFFYDSVSLKMGRDLDDGESAKREKDKESSCVSSFHQYYTFLFGTSSNGSVLPLPLTKRTPFSSLHAFLQFHHFENFSHGISQSALLVVEVICRPKFLYQSVYLVVLKPNILWIGCTWRGTVTMLGTRL